MIYQPSPVVQTAEVTLSSAELTVSLKNNTLYTLSNSAITAINLSADSGMKYTRFDFATSSTAPTFSYPSVSGSEWIFEGDDCDDGVFIPLASSRYRVAVECGFNTYIGTVQKVSTIS